MRLWCQRCKRTLKNAKRKTRALVLAGKRNVAPSGTLAAWAAGFCSVDCMHATEVEQINVPHRINTVAEQPP